VPTSASSVSTPSSSPPGLAAPSYQHAQGGPLPIAVLALVGTLWSIGGVLIKAVPWPPLAIWSVRSAIAAIAILCVRRISWRGISRTEWLAAAALALTTALFVAANKYTTAANAILIQYSAPAWVAILGALWLGERATRLDWLTIAVALGGITLFFFEKLTFDHTTGNLFALAAGMTFAVHVAAARRLAQQGRSPLRAIFLGHVLAMVGGAPMAVSAMTSAPLEAQAWLALVALGIFQQAVPSLLYAWAMQRATALEGLLVPILEPILSPCWVWLFIGEAPGRWAVAGGALVVGAVTARALFGLRQQRAVAAAAAAAP
jgi:drug/metabolite transporter (DMT)-like permease